MHSKFICIIFIIQNFLVDKTLSKNIIVILKIDMKCNPAVINNTKLSFTYKIVNERKYIKNIEPMTSIQHKNLNNDFVSNGFVEFIHFLVSIYFKLQYELQIKNSANGLTVFRYTFNMCNL